MFAPSGGSAGGGGIEGPTAPRPAVGASAPSDVIRAMKDFLNNVSKKYPHA